MTITFDRWCVPCGGGFFSCLSLQVKAFGRSKVVCSFPYLSLHVKSSGRSKVVCKSRRRRGGLVGPPKLTKEARRCMIWRPMIIGHRAIVVACEDHATASECAGTFSQTNEGEDKREGWIHNRRIPSESYEKHDFVRVVNLYTPTLGKDLWPGICFGYWGQVGHFWDYVMRVRV